MAAIFPERKVRLAEPLDQASGLRRLFTTDAGFRAVGILGPDARRNARVSAGLALALGRRGAHALILDEASAPHNVASLLGIVARQTLRDGARSGHLDQVILPAGEGVDLLAAHDSMSALASLDERAALHLGDRFAHDVPQWLLLNAGVGSTPGLAATADLRVLVLPGAKTHLAAAYTVMKSAYATWPGKDWQIVVEGLEAQAAKPLFASLAETAQRFLGIECGFLGALPRRTAGLFPATSEAFFVDLAAGAGKSQEIGIMAGRLADLPIGEPLEFEQYWQRMWMYCRMTAEAETTRTRHDRWSGR